MSVLASRFRRRSPLSMVPPCRRQYHDDGYQHDHEHDQSTDMNRAPIDRMSTALPCRPYEV
jgi:hypothetical protein